jgi:uncharacterized membrane protein YcaP (DUF421 family)
MLGQVDWGKVFVPDTPLLEIFVRGTIIYLGLFIMLRVVRREAGTVSIPDLLVVVLIADAAQNAMASDYTSVTDGLLLVVTIVGWSYILNWLGYQVPAIGRFVHPPPLLLIKDGLVLRQNLRRQFVTFDELMSHLREQGVEDPSEVKAAYIEGDGHISVLTYEDQPHHGEDRAPAQ